MPKMKKIKGRKLTILRMIIVLEGRNRQNTLILKKKNAIGGLFLFKK